MPEYVITIFNVDTKIGHIVYSIFEETIYELESTLEENEILFVNEVLNPDNKKDDYDWSNNR